MFGHNNNDIVSQDQQQDAHVPLPDEAIADITSAHTPDNQQDFAAGAPSVADDTAQPTHSLDGFVQPPAPQHESLFTPSPQSSNNSFPEPSDELGHPSDPVSETSHLDALKAPEPHHEALLDIKQNALQSLTPLVSTLDLDPAEKFKTLMMMIQASDDHSLLHDAYETAQKISDEKERAQALLDVVNEINYFTHQDEAKK